MTGPLLGPPMLLTWWPHAPEDAGRELAWLGQPGPRGTWTGTAWFGEGIHSQDYPGRVEATWTDAGWQPTPRQDHVQIVATADELTLSVPPVWRTQLHLGWRADRLYVSSDLRTLATALVRTEPWPEGIAAFLVSGRAGRGLVPSLYRDIWTLRPGFRITARASRQPACERHWRPEADAQFDSLPLATATAHLRENLERISEEILTSHERVGCLFSGGLDSSLVAALLLRRAPERVVLFNLGSAFGTAAEAKLRARFLKEFDTASHAVDLPEGASLIRSLRATNAVAPLPAGSVFAHVFEEIIAVASRHGCDVLATGDGGDEVFAERQDALVDLLPRGNRDLLATAGRFALRNGERMTSTLFRAVQVERALRKGTQFTPEAGPVRMLFGDVLASHAQEALAAESAATRGLWQDGWTMSGIASWRRAANVPEWEPINASTPAFPLASPLADVAVVEAALRLQREDRGPLECGDHPKRLLRNAALAWLPAEVANHPKIGSADGELLRLMRLREHEALLELFSSETARRAGLRLSSAAEDPASPLWHGDHWIRAAALVSWYEHPAPAEWVSDRGGDHVRLDTISPSHEIAPSLTPPRRAPTSHVVLLAVLNAAAQLAPIRVKFTDAPGSKGTSDLTAVRHVLTDLARRSCVMPFVTGASPAMHRALFWYVRLLGIPARLVEGVGQGETTPRYWIEIDGETIEVNGAEVPLISHDQAPGSPEPVL